MIELTQKRKKGIPRKRLVLKRMLNVKKKFKAKRKLKPKKRLGLKRKLRLKRRVGKRRLRRFRKKRVKRLRIRRSGKSTAALKLDGSKPELHAFLNNPDQVLELSKAAMPLISIVLVLYNKAEFTLACLKTLQQHADVPYEIIIVDNASNDETPLLLAKLRHAAVQTNKENLGFSKASNQGARLANGAWILFLNNDTQLTPHILSTLLRTGEERNKCGAVGGKLIYPDGKLQEAGSILWNEGSCQGYGRGGDPNKAEYCYVKEVDYCSGALLLVKKHIFIEIGMFDEQYSPAYYEEVDLCMKIRGLGYKVYYQPLAVLTHHEYGSLGHSAAGELLLTNKAKFYHKWRNELVHYHPPDRGLAIYGREHNRGRFKILVIDDRIPEPELGTGYPRTFTILTCLAELDYQITYYPLLNSEKPEPCTQILQQKGIEVMYSLPHEGLDFSRFFAERSHLYDAVWISRPHNMAQISQTIRSIRPDQKIIYDAEALFSLRDVLLLELQGNTVSEQDRNDRIRRETALMDNADIVIAVTDNERQVIQRFTEKPTLVLGHHVDMQPTPNAYEQRNGILFVGGFLTSPSSNVDAVQYFVNDIYPRVFRELGTRLWIVGTNHSEAIWRLASEHIIVTGRVGNIWDYYNNCRVFIAPTRYAAGIPLKVLGSLSHGLPTIVTPLIADQLSLSEDVALVGYDNEDFAEKLIRTYNDARVWHHLREHGFQYIKQECRKEAYTDRLNKLKQMVGR